MNEGLSAQLTALIERGVARFDPVATRLIQGLEERAPSLPKKARERVLQRAQAHLDDLEQRFRTSQRRETRWRSELPPPVADAVYPSSFEGTEREARRRARKLRRRLERGPDRAGEKTPGYDRPSEIRSQTRRKSHYDEAAAAAAAQLALVRSEDSVPEASGRYHPPEVAARALRMMERLGRPYLYAQLRRFEDFAALSALQALDPPPPKKRRKRNKRKSQSSS